MLLYLNILEFNLAIDRSLWAISEINIFFSQVFTLFSDNCYAMIHSDKQSSCVKHTVLCVTLMISHKGALTDYVQCSWWFILNFLCGFLYIMTIPILERDFPKDMIPFNTKGWKLHIFKFYTTIQVLKFCT